MFFKKFRFIYLSLFKLKNFELKYLPRRVLDFLPPLTNLIYAANLTCYPYKLINYNIKMIFCWILVNRNYLKTSIFKI